MRAADYALLVVVALTITYLVVTATTTATTDMFNNTVQLFDDVQHK